MWLLSNNISSDQIWEEGVTKSGVINDYLQYLMNTPSEGLRAQGLLPEKNPIWDKSCFLTSVKSCCSGSKKESSWDFGKVGSHDCFAFCSRARQSSASHCLDRGQIWVVRQRRRRAWRGLPALSTHASRVGSSWSLRGYRLLKYFGFKDYLCWRREFTILLILTSSELSPSVMELTKTARASSNVCSAQRRTPRSSTEEARWRLISSSSYKLVLLTVPPIFQ